MSVKNLDNKYKILILLGFICIIGGGVFFVFSDDGGEKNATPTIAIAKTKVDLSMYDNTKSIDKGKYMVDVAPAAPDSFGTTDTLPFLDFKRTEPSNPLFKQRITRTRKGPQQTTQKQHTEQQQPREKDDLEAFLSTSHTSKSLTKKASETKAITAVIYGDQKIKNGERVRLRTTSSGIIGNLEIPYNAIIYGVGTLNANRMVIRISKVVLNGKEETRGFSSNTAIYDATDGELGIYVQGIDGGESVRGGARDVASGVLVQGGALGRIANSILQKTTTGEVEVLLLNDTKLLIQ